MAFTPVETIALILVLAVAIKLIVILIKPGAWMKVVKKIYGNSGILMIVSLILAAVVLYYLTQAGMTIIQILAAGTFIALLMAVSAAAYSKEILGMAQKLLRDKAVLKKAWLALLIWIVLIIWALYVLFA